MPISAHTNRPGASLPLERVGAELLLVETGASVPVFAAANPSSVL